MRKGFLVLAVMVLVLAVEAFAFQNEPEGFRGLKWGDPPTEDMEKESEIGMGIVIYERLDDKLSLGDVELDYIFYVFYQDKFMRVSLHFSGKSNYELLEMICRQKFGKKSSGKLYELHWVGSLSSVSLAYSLKWDEGILGLNGVVIFEEYDKALKALLLSELEKKQIEKAEGDW